MEGLLGPAFTVKAMCPAEVSGVMFTANPVSRDREQVVIESAPGLGEAIVLGKVTPDHFAIDKQSGVLIEQTLQNANGQPTLCETHLRELVDLGKRVESHFQVPCDIEWALSRGRFFLLQSRPIKGFSKVSSQSSVVSSKTPFTSVPSSPEAGVESRKDHSPLTIHHSPDRDDLERIRKQEITVLAAKADPEGTVWSRYNLAELLPAPTPMTWAIVPRFMSGQCGFGRLYRLQTVP